MILLLGQAAAAATLTVGPTGDYAAIQEAVDAAAAGDEIVVDVGTYEGFTVATPAIRIVADFGPTYTMLSGPISVVSGAEGFELEGFSLGTTGSRIDADATLTDLVADDHTGSDHSITIGSGVAVSISRLTCRRGAVHCVYDGVDSEVVVVESTFEEPTLQAVYVRGNARLTVRDSDFTLVEAADIGMGILGNFPADVTIENTTFTGGGTEVYYGAVIAVSSPTATLRDVAFENVGRSTSLADFYQFSAVELTRVFVGSSDVDAMFTGEAAAGASVAVEALATCATPAPAAQVRGAALDASLTLANSTILDQPSGDVVTAPVVTVRRSIVAGLSDFDTSATWSDVATNRVVTTPGVEQLDLRLPYLLGEACELGHLEVDPLGPLVNAAADGALDRDGSVADLGCFGGPESFVLSADYDFDGDGVGRYFDCDDLEPSSFPGNDEVAYDGVDQDCSGADLCDVDADGFAAEACDGDDCEDGDPDVAPGRLDETADGVDQDCDGTDGPGDTDTEDADTDAGDPCDADGDGAAGPQCAGPDCDDADPSVGPEANDSSRDGVDQDCDGSDYVPDAAVAGACSASGALPRWAWVLAVLAAAWRTKLRR